MPFHVAMIEGALSATRTKRRNDNEKIINVDVHINIDITIAATSRIAI